MFDYLVLFPACPLKPGLKIHDFMVQVFDDFFLSNLRKH